jgi:hypothetical protein
VSARHWNVSSSGRESVCAADLHDIHSLHDLSEDDVLAIQPLSLGSAQEELKSSQCAQGKERTGVESAFMSTPAQTPISAPNADLASVGAGSSVGHGQHTGASVLQPAETHQGEGRNSTRHERLREQTDHSIQQSHISLTGSSHQRT